ncbi:unnamed protein product, partial [marine sediment metagenome]
PDIEVEVVGLNRKKIKAKIFLPANETIKICQNKIEFNKLMEEKNIPVTKILFLFLDIIQNLLILYIQGYL